MDSIQVKPVLHTKLSQKAVPLVSDLKTRQKKQSHETQKARDGESRSNIATIETPKKDRRNKTLHNDHDVSRDDTLMTNGVSTQISTNLTNGVSDEIKSPAMKKSTKDKSLALDDKAHKKTQRSDIEKANLMKRDPEANARYQKELKRAKRERRKARLEAGVVATDQPLPAAAATTVRGKKAKVPRIAPSRQEIPLTVSRRGGEKWKLSQPVGGRFADIHPLFSKDEKFLLLAQSHMVKIYSTKTSLLARSLSVNQPPESAYRPSTQPPFSKVVGCVFHPREADKLYTLTSIGDIWLWNWLEGTVEGWWSTDLHSTSGLGRGGIFITSENEQDVLWFCEAKGKARFLKQCIIAKPIAHPANITPERLSTRTIHEVNGHVQALQVIDTKTFALISANTIHIGNRFKKANTEGQWGEIRKFTTEHDLTCLDVLPPPEAQDRKGKPNPRSPKSDASKRLGDLVVGDKQGIIWVYHDIVERSQEIEKPTIRRLHWHRSAVASVRFGLNGTYVISGGRETVLVIWQLSTSHKQFLPHLSATIEDIVISPRGRDYAIKLGDNSIMIISTTELKPKTHIAGIQSRYFTSVKNEEQVLADTSWTVPCVIHPKTPTQVLLAAPSSQLEGSSSPFVQTYDSASDRGVTRQALTRTLASQKNVSPDGTALREPNIKFMAISSDASWLATVDEWAAPALDFVDVHAPKPPANAIVSKEVFLRFWQWDSSQGAGQWEQVTRIDLPHSSAFNGSAFDITDLVASPSSHSFTTVGNDGTAKIWKPRARTRAGVKVEKEGVLVWGCRKVIEITKNLPDEYIDAKIAYSSDGSILAVATSENDDAVIYIINAFSGLIQQTITSLQTNTIFELQFVDQYLVVAGASRLIVWDLIASQTHWSYELGRLIPRDQLESENFVPNIFLSADGKTKTFAIAINHAKKNSSEKRVAINTASQIFVFNVNAPSPIFIEKVENAVVALKSISSSISCASSASESHSASGYMWLDGNSEIRFLSPQASMTSARGIPSPTEIEDAYLEVGGVSNAYHTQQKLNAATIDDTILDEEDGDARVVRADMLAQLFPAPPYASTALEDVFERFMGLVGQKPLASGDVGYDEDEERDNEQGVLTNGVHDDEGVDKMVVDAEQVNDSFDEDDGEQEEE